MQKELKMNILLSLLITCFSCSLLANTDGASARRVATPRSKPVQINSNDASYRSVYYGLQSLGQAGSVNCNQSFLSSAHALICNCANEAGNQNLEGMTAVSRVVFSRAKSSNHPSNVKKVICERHQFSWTIGGWYEDCTRARGKPTYFNSPKVQGAMLKNCVKTAQLAARLELVDNPNKLFALNYCSTNPRAYRNAIPGWCRGLLNTQRPIDGHVFGFAGGRGRLSIPTRGSTPISWFDYIKELKLFDNLAHASDGGPQITNTKSKRRLVYGDKIETILQKKYKTFTPYKFDEYDKSVKNLIKGTRNNLPAALIGDYNGDGKQDLVLMGSDKKKQVILAFLSDKKGYTDFVVNSENEYSKPLDLYLMNIPKKKIIFNNKKDRDAFQVEKFGGAAVAKLFDGQKFVDNNSKTGFKFR